MRSAIAATKQHAAEGRSRQLPGIKGQAAGKILGSGLGMDMRKTGAPAQGQPASVVTDGIRLLLTGGEHDGVGCRMPPDAPGCPGMPKAARWVMKGRGGYKLEYKLGYEFGYWLGCTWGHSAGIVGGASASHGKSILLPDTSDPASRAKSPDVTRILPTGMSSRLVDHGDW